MQNQTTIYGIDISKNQGNEISQLSSGTDGLSFIICKATDGITYTDPDFGTNWAGIAEKGFVRGAYHFYRGNDDPEKQVNNFLTAVGSLLSSDLPPVIDIEELGLVNCPDVSAVQQSVLSLLSIVKSGTNRRPVIYTDKNTAMNYLNSNEFAEYPLYLAEYGVAAPSVAGTAWENTGWTFWQKGTMTIGSTSNDYDVFNGDVEALQTFIADN